MPHQTTITEPTAPHDETAVRAVARNTGEFLHDLVTLGELHLRLLLVDGQEGLRGLVVPVMLLALGVIVAVAASPVALIALAWALAETTSLSLAQAGGIATVTGLLLAGLLGACGWWRWQVVSSQPFERTAREWQQNVKWIKHVLQRSGGDRSGEQRRSSPPYVSN